MPRKVIKVKVPRGKSGKVINVRTPSGTIMRVRIPPSKKAGEYIMVPLPDAEQDQRPEDETSPPPSVSLIAPRPARPAGPSATALSQAGLGTEWANSNIDRSEFLEIASLRRILVSGVSVTRHVDGLTQPVSVFCTKLFDAIYWYQRHQTGVQEYKFQHLVDVLPVTSARSVGINFPTAIQELNRIEAQQDQINFGHREVDVSERSFVLVFEVPAAEANLATSEDLSQAVRMAHDQKADWYGLSLEELRQATAANGTATAASASVADSGGSGGDTDGADFGDEAKTVKLSVDLVCDNIWTYEMLVSGFSLIKAHYADLLKSPHMSKLKDISGPREHEGAFGDDRGASGVDGAMKQLTNRMHKDGKTGRANNLTQGMNSLHQLYDPSHHPNHRQKFKVKVGTEVEVLFRKGAYRCVYKKAGMDPIGVDLNDNKYFKAGKYCLGIITKRYRDDTYDVRYLNGPYNMDEDPDNSRRPLFPRNGLKFERVPKAFLIVDYDAQLVSPFPWGMVLLSFAQTVAFVYYVSVHEENSQGQVSATEGVAGDQHFYLQSMGMWPQCENLIWGDGEYWRLGSYQMVHFGLNHIGFNMMAQLLFGTPIERVHGTYRIMLLYQLGVFGSSLFAGWTDPMKIVVGASGGVYTILGAHWANMAISWSAMKNGTVPPIARMIVLSSLVGIDVVQYLFYRAGGTSYAVHLGGWLIGFAGGILVLRELEADWFENWVVKPLALITFVLLVGYSIYWDSSHWPPKQPWWVKSINFGDSTRQCCWLVSECKDYGDDRGARFDLPWGPEQWEQLKCNADYEDPQIGGNGWSYTVSGNEDGYGDSFEVSSTNDFSNRNCEKMYDYIYNSR